MDTGTQAPTQVQGYDVVDPQGNKIGTVGATWVDANNSNALEFIGVKTGLLGDPHVVPAGSVQVDAANSQVQVPYAQDTVKNAPTCGTSDSMTQEQEQQITSYYQNAGTVTTGPASSPATTAGTTATQATAVPGSTVSEQRTVPPGDFPVDDLTYDLLTLLQEKLQTLEVYDHYLDDAGNDSTVVNFLQALRTQDAQAATQLRQMVAQRLAQ